ncbi:hypothetical protein [Streptomyces inhibens]|uniref:hypothetical protein n=1 Tax=Streptomyces inhibens TaxID=2293571 RepID=UPI001FD08726|nr:hypothetical protein [Streptomyces inhibens]
MPNQNDQPYLYRRREMAEPDWRRIPAWRHVTVTEWRSAQWQRAHCVRNISQLQAVYGDLLDEYFYTDLDRDQRERATMSLLIPPHMLNTMAPLALVRGAGSLTAAFRSDPVRRYTLPVSRTAIPTTHPTHSLRGTRCTRARCG